MRLKLRKVYGLGTCILCQKKNRVLALHLGGYCKRCKCALFSKTPGFRSAVLRRDGLKCVICGVRTRLKIHHILHIEFFPQLKKNINNGIVLCKLHEAEAHGRFTSKNMMLLRH